MGKNLQKIYFPYYSLLIMRDLWQACYQILKNLSEGIYRIKRKFGHDYKKCETCGIKYKYCNCFLEYKNFKDLVEYKCLCCNKIYQQKFDEKLKKNFLIHENALTMIALIYMISLYFIVAKRRLFLWIYGWLGKIQWNIIAWKRR